MSVIELFPIFMLIFAICERDTMQEAQHFKLAVLFESVVRSAEDVNFAEAMAGVGGTTRVWRVLTGWLK